MAKKIGAIVSISIIGILIIATIIMANVNVNYSVKCATPTSVWVQYGSNAERDAQDKASTIVEYINNASKEKSLTALFNGTLGKKAKVVAASNVGKTIPSNSGFNVRYRYENAQKLVEGKKEYKDSNGEVVYYEDLVFTVVETNGTEIVNVYVIQDAEKPTTYTYYYELEANFNALYDYLADNNFKI